MSELSGMTGFARVTGEADWGTWAWEAKSVNGRGLDVRVNTPPGFDALDRAIKTEAAKLFKRGSLQVSLRIEMSSEDGDVTVNEALLHQLYKAAREVRGDSLDGQAVATLMTIKGVVESGSQSIRDIAADEAAMDGLLKGGQAALKDLKAARLDEGTSLQTILGGLLDDLEATTQQAVSLAGDQPTLLKARLEKQLSELGAEDKVDPDRLAAEIALSSAKADVQEELDRLLAHVDSGRALIKGGSPVGRKLDFLAQELNRESNTLCSKSISLDLTNAGLSLKGMVDQFKEQSANAE